MARQFLILHGWQGSGPTHWQTWLANELRKRGEKVVYPELPNPMHPKLEEWLAALHDVISALSPSDTITVITHSLGGALWIQYVARHPEFASARAFFVAPTPDDCDIADIASFFPLPNIRITHPASVLVCSENDNYIIFEKFQLLAHGLRISVHHVVQSGHINVASGFGAWPWILTTALQ